jgi:hypothetical protein
MPEVEPLIPPLLEASAVTEETGGAPPPPPPADEEIQIQTPGEPVNSPAPQTSKARGVDLAEIDRYLEGLNKL